MDAEDIRKFSFFLSFFCIPIKYKSGRGILCMKKFLEYWRSLPIEHQDFLRRRFTIATGIALAAAFYGLIVLSNGTFFSACIFLAVNLAFISGTMKTSIRNRMWREEKIAESQDKPQVELAIPNAVFEHTAPVPTDYLKHNKNWLLILFYWYIILMGVASIFIAFTDTSSTSLFLFFGICLILFGSKKLKKRKIITCHNQFIFYNNSCPNCGKKMFPCKPFTPKNTDTFPKVIDYSCFTSTTGHYCPVCSHYVAPGELANNRKVTLINYCVEDTSFNENNIQYPLTFRYRITRMLSITCFILLIIFVALAFILDSSTTNLIKIILLLFNLGLVGYLLHWIWKSLKKTYCTLTQYGVYQNISGTSIFPWDKVDMAVAFYQSKFDKNPGIAFISSLDLPNYIIFPIYENSDKLMAEILRRLPDSTPIDPALIERYLS